MKKIICIICLFCVALVVRYSSITVDGVKIGMDLCLYTVIPSLLPFLLLTNLMLKWGGCHYISKIFYPLFSRLFKVSKNGCFAIITGFTCGYPIGAKTIMDLQNSNMISKPEAKHLLTFCNNSSISFIINYLALYCLKSQISPFLLVLLILLPALLTGFINARFIKSPFTGTAQAISNSNKDPISSTIKSLSGICCYVLIFSVLANWIIKLVNINPLIKSVILCFLEITTGSAYISANIFSFDLALLLIGIFTILGGGSITAQTMSYVNDKSYIVYYILGKLEAITIFIIAYMIFT